MVDFAKACLSEQHGDIRRLPVGVHMDTMVFNFTAYGITRTCKEMGIRRGRVKEKRCSHPSSIRGLYDVV